MDAELTAATQFLASYLPLNAPAPTFAAALQSLLAERYHNHWYPQDPEKGSAFRALLRFDSMLDLAIVSAAAQASIGAVELKAALSSTSSASVATTAPTRKANLRLGERWTMWVDPGCVSLRIEREVKGSFSTTPRGGQFIEIYGRLPPSLAAHAIPLEQAMSSSLNISSSPPLAAATPGIASAFSPPPSTTSPAPAGGLSYDSPTKRGSKAIQILRPPASALAGSRATSGSWQGRPASPAASLLPALPISSPFITPPTPLRPSSVSNNGGDIFSSPTSSLSTDAMMKLASSSVSTDGSSASSSSTLTLGTHVQRPGSQGSDRRHASSSSSRSSASETSSDAEDGVFSSTESLSSLSSSATSAGTLWTHPLHHAKSGSTASFTSHRAGSVEEFKVPALPPYRSRTPSNSTSGANSFVFPPRSHSSASSHHPGQSPSPFQGHSGSHSHHASLNGGRSAPNSPSKPRRRGTRGGGGGNSISKNASNSNLAGAAAAAAAAGGHESSSSISSLAAVLPATPFTPSSSSAAQAAMSRVTEYSGAKVGVLSGGVLLGLAGAERMGNARSEVVGEAKRRGRERRRVQPKPVVGAVISGAVWPPLS